MDNCKNNIQKNLYTKSHCFVTILIEQQIDIYFIAFASSCSFLEKSNVLDVSLYLKYLKVSDREYYVYLV